MFALFEPYHADYCIYTCNSIRNNFVQDRNGMVISYSIGYFGQPIWSCVLYIPSNGLPNAFVGPGPLGLGPGQVLLVRTWLSLRSEGHLRGIQLQLLYLKNTSRTSYSSFISISARFLASKSNIFLVFFRYYTFNLFVNMRESRNFEFKTGGGAYPIHILPEVR